MLMRITDIMKAFISHRVFISQTRYTCLAHVTTTSSVFLTSRAFYIFKEFMKSLTTDRIWVCGCSHDDCTVKFAY